MTALERTRHRLVDYGSPDSLAARARQRRWQLLLSQFPDLDAMRVIDLGGTVEAWNAAPVQPAELTILNLSHSGAGALPPTTLVVGDACALPDEVAGRRFDLVYSNSLVEHVGGVARRMDFASSVASLSERHWVQTPYRYFPVEPHWLFPGFQFLPLCTRALISRTWPVMGWRSADIRHAVGDALWVELLSRTEMLWLFPDSTILAERLGGLTKSLIAVR